MPDGQCDSTHRNMLIFNKLQKPMDQAFIIFFKVPIIALHYNHIMLMFIPFIYLLGYLL